MQQLLRPLPTLTLRHIAETVQLSPCVTCCAMMRAALSSRHASTSSQHALQPEQVQQHAAAHNYKAGWPAAAGTCAARNTCFVK